VARHRKACSSTPHRERETHTHTHAQAQTYAEGSAVAFVRYLTFTFKNVCTAKFFGSSVQPFPVHEPIPYVLHCSIQITVYKSNFIEMFICSIKTVIM
jgi:hypothetical protein